MTVPRRPAPRRFVMVVLLLVPLGLLALMGGARPSPAADTPPAADRLSTITVPHGFVVERVAGPPLVEHPYMATFDERGRLYVCDAAGLNLDAKHLLADPPNRIVR